MSFDYAPLQAERRPVPNMNLASNNPFRRAILPDGPPPPQAIHNGNGNIINNGNKIASTNPFLDNYQTPSYPISIPAQNRQRSPPKPMAVPPPYSMSASPKKNTFMPGSVPTQMMNGMSLNDRPMVGRRSPPRAGPPSSFRQARNHRHSRSQDENMRAFNEGGPAEGKLIDIFATPEKDKTRAGNTRRNSETSVLEAKLEERRQDRTARDARLKDGKSRDPKTKKSKKPNPQMDLIDKLDVTSIYGTGMFHHDGPFDACNPHRNRKAKAAPMQAFPEGSANNTMGGSGPVNKTLDYDRYHGRHAEGFTDFNITNATAPVEQQPNRLQRPDRQDRRPSADRAVTDFNPRDKLEPVHGNETQGLGTSTFLEGAPAPASRLALQRATSEQDRTGGAGGLLRKKSLAQRIRGISRPRGQGFGDAGRVLSPEARYIYADNGRTPPVPTLDPQSAGGRGRMVEVNPFFSEGSESKAPPHIKIADASEYATGPGRQRGLSSPQTPLFRTKTNESIGGNDNESKTSNLLNRVKSLRGGRRPRGERRAS